MVARFLALLELYREGLIEFEQPVSLDELTVRWVGGDADGELDIDDYEGARPTGETADGGSADGGSADGGSADGGSAVDSESSTAPDDAVREPIGRHRQDGTRVAAFGVGPDGGRGPEHAMSDDSTETESGKLGAILSDPDVTAPGTMGPGTMGTGTMGTGTMGTRTIGTEGRDERGRNEYDVVADAEAAALEERP